VIVKACKALASAKPVQALGNLRRAVLDGERVWIGARRFALHSSAAGFSADFVHQIYGHAMVFAEAWERVHGVAVSYSAFAATLIVYIDGHRERVRYSKDCQKVQVAVE
jgi:hypothetical protein